MSGVSAAWRARSSAFQSPLQLAQLGVGENYGIPYIIELSLRAQDSDE